MTTSLHELERAAREFSERLGARCAPTLRIVAGHHCRYTAHLHCISMGEEALRALDADSIRAILAHEVGHATQRESALERIRYRIGGWGIVMVALAAVLAVFNCGWVAVGAGALGTPMLWWHASALPPMHFAKVLARELDADARAASLVGAHSVAHALFEYGERFAPGPMGPMTRLRLLRLKELGASPDS